MSNGNALVRVTPANPFEPAREAFRFEMPPAAVERLCDLAKIPAHYRPTFANSIKQLFAKARRWHRIALRAVEMDAVSRELGRVAREARKLQKSIDGLSERARMTLGLYALRLDQFGEAEAHETVRNQIEDLLNGGSLEQASPKVDYLSWTAGRLGSAAATETWPKPQNGNPALWGSGNSNRSTPHLDTFNGFVIELGNMVRACNSPLSFQPDAISDGLRTFLEAAKPYLPDGFIPDEAFDTGEETKRTGSSPLNRLTSFWQRR
jgi:hypothetical protein